MEQKFNHVVCFWLKENINETDRSAFETGVKSLGTISSVANFHLGVPAKTNRPVIDRSYDYCLICTFQNEADHDAYQIDPVHDVFRETCAVYWDKVLIYDSTEIA